MEKGVLPIGCSGNFSLNRKWESLVKISEKKRYFDKIISCWKMILRGETT